MDSQDGVERTESGTADICASISDSRDAEEQSQVRQRDEDVACALIISTTSSFSH